MNTFICGMVFAGVGAGINELTALAATSELAPTSKRGKYVAVLIFTILPFVSQCLHPANLQLGHADRNNQIPSVLYGQLIAYYSTWRWIGLFCGLWAFIGLAFVVIFYFPPPRVNSQGMSSREVLRQIDYIGQYLRRRPKHVANRQRCRWHIVRWRDVTLHDGDGKFVPDLAVAY